MLLQSVFQHFSAFNSTSFISQRTKDNADNWVTNINKLWSNSYFSTEHQSKLSLFFVTFKTRQIHSFKDLFSRFDQCKDSSLLFLSSGLWCEWIKLKQVYWETDHFLIMMLLFFSENKGYIIYGLLEFTPTCRHLNYNCSKAATQD